MKTNAGFTISGLAIIAACSTSLLVYAQPTKSTRDGVYTKAQAERGKPVYDEHCATCHAPSLGGGEMAPAIANADFESNWNGLTLGDLFERIRTTMPQDKPGSLSAQQNSDILAYMLQVGAFPAGETELSKDAAFLKDIKYDPPKR
ncbi:MAG: cytochrome c [Vicinamibacterales bacterium]